MERVLAYDRAIAPQETGYWCGPASTQMVLNSLGIFEQESVLAREMGTHTGGTDHIGLVARVLNDRTGGGYVVRTILNDPPRPEQIDQLWDDAVASINAGFGVVGNIMVPPGNYPRGTRGSISPAYRGGWVYHYFALMGWADDGPDGGRHFWVADSGFPPFGYWCSLEQVASMIAGKGYTAKPVGPAADEVPTNVDRLVRIDREVRLAHDQAVKTWPQLGGRNVRDAVAAIVERLADGR